MTIESEYPIYTGVSLGEKIAALLKGRGMEQQDLAKKLGVAPSSVSDWVQGKTHPRRKRLPDIADALGVPVDELRAAWFAGTEGLAA